MYSNSGGRHRGGLPSYGGYSDGGALFDGKGGTVNWNRVYTLVLFAAAIVLFVTTLFQGNRINLLNLDKHHCESEIARRDNEANALRAALSNAQQEKESTELQLEESLREVKHVQDNAHRAMSFRDSLQEEIRESSKDLRNCRQDAKKREEELEAEVASLTQERNDLKIRVDTEHSMSATWAKKLAEAQKETKECKTELVLKSQTTAEGNEKAEAVVDVDLGRKDIADQETKQEDSGDRGDAGEHRTKDAEGTAEIDLGRRNVGQR